MTCPLVLSGVKIPGTIFSNRLYLIVHRHLVDTSVAQISVGYSVLVYLLIITIRLNNGRSFRIALNRLARGFLNEELSIDD